MGLGDSFEKRIGVELVARCDHLRRLRFAKAMGAGRLLGWWR